MSKEGDDDPLSALTAPGPGDGDDVGGDSASAGRRAGGGGGGGHSRGSSAGSAAGGSSGGAWRRYYEGLELIEEIKRDLTRLYPRWVSRLRPVASRLASSLFLACLEQHPTAHSPITSSLITRARPFVHSLPFRCRRLALACSGVEEQHFMAPRVQEILLAVLFVWATLHKSTAYRQVRERASACTRFIM